MARKDDVESEEPVVQENAEQQVQEQTVQIISDSQLIHLKLDKILEILTKE